MADRPSLLRMRGDLTSALEALDEALQVVEADPREVRYFLVRAGAAIEKALTLPTT